MLWPKKARDSECGEGRKAGRGGGEKRDLAVSINMKIIDRQGRERSGTSKTERNANQEWKDNLKGDRSQKNEQAKQKKKEKKKPIASHFEEKTHRKSQRKKKKKKKFGGRKKKKRKDFCPRLADREEDAANAID